MTFNDIFQAYYTLFRADSDIPAGAGIVDSASWDAEYTVGMRLANEAISYWANYDGTYWKELFDTNLSDGTGSQTIVAGTTSYTPPENFREAGGFVKILDPYGNEQTRYPIIEPSQAQFKDKSSNYCYFKGDPNNGYTLNINPVPPSNLVGNSIDYVYYKTPTYFATGLDTTEMPDPYFIVHRVLGMQFRAARNPYYQSAIKDSENTIRVMQLDNNSGSWANPWELADNSGSVWGESYGSH